MEGTVKFYNATKGFGFIKDNNSKEEYFVHASGLVHEIQENDVVSFKLIDGKKGKNAVDVEVIG